MSGLSREAREWMAAARDYLSLARVASRTDFAAACPFPFLVCRRERLQAGAPGRTQTLSLDGRSLAPASGGPLLFAVRKVQESDPSMITVGRTLQHDIAIPDWAVSRFHAFFPRLDGDRLALVDAGSHNGTWVDGERLAPHAAARPLRLGSRVRFGRFTFLLVDAGGCWDAVAPGAPAGLRRSG